MEEDEKSQMRSEATVGRKAARQPVYDCKGTIGQSSPGAGLGEALQLSWTVKSARTAHRISLLELLDCSSRLGRVVGSRAALAKRQISCRRWIYAFSTLGVKVVQGGEVGVCNGIVQK